MVTHDVHPSKRLQQLEVPSNLINDALGRRANSQHRRTAARDLRPSRIVNNMCYQSQAQCLRLQQL